MMDAMRLIVEISKFIMEFNMAVTFLRFMMILIKVWLGLRLMDNGLMSRIEIW